MKSAVLLLLLIFSLNALAEDENFSFKTYYLGANYNDIKAEKRGCDSRKTNISDQSCFFKDTIAGVPAHVLMSFVNESLVSIYIGFDVDGFKDVELALKEKYGSPSSENVEIVQNKMGASFDNKKVIWHRGKSSLYLTQRSGKITTSSAKISLDSYTEQFVERQKENAQKNADDL